MDYTRNAKNRKLKTQIREFFGRIFFGTHRLGLSGKGMLLSIGLLALSLFFPWMSSVSSLGDTPKFYTAFSLYTGSIGYGILIGVGVQLFFLLSHARKERIRAYVPFRLSDTQAIVFIDAMIITGILHFPVISFAFGDLTAYTFHPGFGLKLGLFASFLLVFSAFFFSKYEKERAVKMSYLATVDETSYKTGYEDILETKGEKENDNKKNMSLPI